MGGSGTDRRADRPRARLSEPRDLLHCAGNLRYNYKLPTSRLRDRSEVGASRRCAGIAFTTRRERVSLSKAWRPLFRRTVAFIALFGVIAMPAEAMSPDVGDSDTAPTTSLTAAVDPGAATSHESGQHPESSSHRQLPGHSTHVEHCGHSHVLILAPLPSGRPETTLPAAALSGSTVVPASVSQSPDQRPPIA